MSSEIEASSGRSTEQNIASKTLPSATISKPPVSIQPGSHLDPGAYVRGTFPITIGQNVLIHPRAHLLSVHSPLIIGDGCVVAEKCVLGGPIPVTNQQDKPDSNVEVSDDTTRNETSSSRATVIEDLVHLHPNVTIFHGALIGTRSVIESNTTIESDVVIGAHSKICSTLTISGPISDWTVVWGSTSNCKRRQRMTSLGTSENNGYQTVEDKRLNAMQQERDGTIAMLRTAASKALGGSSRSKK